MACGSMVLQGELDWEHGVFLCENPCLSKLPCGKHACSKKCHPGQCEECELAPGKVQSCLCGKAQVEGAVRAVPDTAGAGSGLIGRHHLHPGHARTPNLARQLIHGLSAAARSMLPRRVMR